MEMENIKPSSFDELEDEVEEGVREETDTNDSIVCENYAASQGDEESKVLSPLRSEATTTDRTDLLGNVLPSARKIPRTFIAAFILLLGWTSFVVIYDVCFDRSLGYIGGITVTSWTWLIDISLCSFWFLWSLFRIQMILLEKMAKSYPTFAYLYYLLYPYELPIHVAAWSLIMLTLFPLVLDRQLGVESIAPAIYSILFSLFAISCLCVAKVTLMAMLEGYFYRDLKDRIVESSRKEKWLLCMEKPHETSATEGLFGSTFAEYGLQQFFVGGLALLAKDKKVTSNNVAHAKLGRYFCTLLTKYDDDRKGYLSRNDFRKFLPPNEVNPAFAMFDVGGDGKVTANDIKLTVTRIFDDRKYLYTQLKSRAMVVDVSDTLLTMVLVVLSIVAILIAFRVDVMTLLVAVGSILLALSFAYSATLSDLMNSLWMFYVAQPFLIGDYVEFGDGKLYIAEKVGLLSSYFHTAEGYGVHIRNGDISKCKIANYNQGSRVVIKIDFSVTESMTGVQYVQLQQRLQQWFRGSKDFIPRFEMYSSGIDPAGGINMVLKGRLKGGTKWQDFSVWRTAKTQLIIAIQEALTEMKLLPAREITVHSMLQRKEDKK